MIGSTFSIREEAAPEWFGMGPQRRSGEWFKPCEYLVANGEGQPQNSPGTLNFQQIFWIFENPLNLTPAHKGFFFPSPLRDEGLSYI